LPSRPERYVVTALAFAVPAVWAGLGTVTAVACVLAAAAAYAAGGAAWQRHLRRAKKRLEKLTAGPPPRRAPVPAHPRRTDEPSEGAISGYGW
jgi:hypothetical protein